MRRGLLSDRRNRHQPVDRQAVSATAKRKKAVRVFRQDARLLRLGSGVDLDVEARMLAEPLDLVGEARRDLLPIDRLDDVEMLDRLARLVALQRSDQVQFDCLAEGARAGAEIPPFGNSLLHPVLAEHGLAADRDRRPDLVGGEGLGDSDQLDPSGSRPQSRARCAIAARNPSRRATASSLPAGSEIRSRGSPVRSATSALPEVSADVQLDADDPFPYRPATQHASAGSTGGTLPLRAARLLFVWAVRPNFLRRI